MTSYFLDEGIKKLGLGLYSEAINFLYEAHLEKPEDPSILNNLGVALKKVSRFSDALECYSLAIKLAPKFIAAMKNRALLLTSTGQLNFALQDFIAISNISPSSDSFLDCGAVCLKLGDVPTALEYFVKASDNAPSNVDALINLGVAYRRLQQFAKSEVCYLKAIKLQPDNPSLYCNLGVLYKEEANFSAAKDMFYHALAIDNCNVYAHINLGLLLLLQGEFSLAWGYFEWRNYLPGVGEFEYAKIFSGETLKEGSSLLVLLEQGVGDFIHYVRYAEFFVRCKVKITFECYPSLLDLLRFNFPMIDFVLKGSACKSDFDYCFPLLTIPHLVDENLVLMERYSYAYIRPTHKIDLSCAASLLRVGVVFRGNSKHHDDFKRSMTIEHLCADLFKLPCAFFFLMPDLSPEEKVYIRNKVFWADFPGVLDYADTANIINSLDVVVTVDTSVAHLAGAMGKRTFLLVSDVPDWRWGLSGAMSRWYPSITIFRNSSHDWFVVLKSVCENLSKLI